MKRSEAEPPKNKTFDGFQTHLTVGDYVEWYHPPQREHILDWLPRAATNPALAARIFPLLQLGQLTQIAAL